MRRVAGLLLARGDGGVLFSKTQVPDLAAQRLFNGVNEWHPGPNLRSAKVCVGARGWGQGVGGVRGVGWSGPECLS